MLFTRAFKSLNSCLCPFFSVSVSTCITTCKKVAPPPVPPRTTSKPYISVTVQSSTESAQDNYLDQQDRRSEVNSQSSHAHSNSSDSLDSTRANSLARGIPRPPHIIPTPIATPREPIAPTTSNASTETRDSAIQHEPPKSGLSKGSLVAEEPLVAPVPRRKLSSIGIQVGSGGGLWLTGTAYGGRGYTCVASVPRNCACRPEVSFG